MCFVLFCVLCFVFCLFCFALFCFVMFSLFCFICVFHLFNLQVEFHPYLSEYSLVKYCQKLNITFNGYSPLGLLFYFRFLFSIMFFVCLLTAVTGAPDHMAFNKTAWPIPILAQPDIQNIAAAHNKTAAQVKQ
jgi:diketogulonate reductase-like aldo/keto reductase